MLRVSLSSHLKARSGSRNGPESRMNLPTLWCMLQEWDKDDADSMDRHGSDRCHMGMATMRSMYSLLLSFTVACSGCVCWFVPCDRRLHVSGHVFDNQHHPVSQASVTFYGVTKETPEDGCFYFDGLLVLLC
jgi:hypothetical protein